MTEVDKDSWAYWYDKINTKEKNDYQFYTRHLTKTDLALEIACGTGRVYLDMLNNGYTVHGIEISENMLNKLRQKAESRSIEPCELFQQDVRHMDLDYDYDFIYFPFNSIAHIDGDVNSQLNAFENIRSHLCQDGEFAFDIYVMDFDTISNYGEMQSKTFEYDGNNYKFEVWSELSSKTEQKINAYNRIINLNKNTIEWENKHELSLYPKQQIELLLQHSGFSNYTFYDGFTEEPLSKNSDKMGIVAKK